jgi:hypothetical protein
VTLALTRLVLRTVPQPSKPLLITPYHPTFGRLTLGYGIFKINTTINFHTNGISFVGIESSSDQTGSVFAGCVIIWTGGASPMFTATTTRIRFVGFGVENQGTATDWLEMNSGAQGNTFENLYFISTATHTSFSRSVIRSNGNRMGYSQFKQLQVTSPRTCVLRCRRARHR